MAKIIGDAALKRANGDSREKIDQIYSKYSRTIPDSTDVS